MAIEPSEEAVANDKPSSCGPKQMLLTEAVCAKLLYTCMHETRHCYTSHHSGNRICQPWVGTSVRGAVAGKPARLGVDKDPVSHTWVPALSCHASACPSVSFSIDDGQKVYNMLCACACSIPMASHSLTHA